MALVLSICMQIDRNAVHDGIRSMAEAAPKQTIVPERDYAPIAGHIRLDLMTGRRGGYRTRGQITPGISLYQHACNFEPLWDPDDTPAPEQYPVQGRALLRRFFATVNGSALTGLWPWRIRRSTTLNGLHASIGYRSLRLSAGPERPQDDVRQGWHSTCCAW